MILLAFSSTRARAADADPAALAYQRALSLYSSGDTAGALSSMRDSFRLSGRWELLYNIARLEDELGDCSAALSDYRQYLERVPQGQYRTPATQASAALSARCPATEPAPPPVVEAPATAAPAAPAAPAVPVAAEPQAAEASPASAAVTTTSATTASDAGSASSAAAPPADQPAPAAESRKTLRWIGWSALTAGALAGAGAVYFTVAAVDARSRFRRSLEREVAGGPYADFGVQDEQHRDQHWAQALAISSGVLVSGGIVALVLSRRAPASAGVTAGVWISPGRVSAQLSSHF